MWIDALDITGFGRLQGTAVRLSRRMTLILGPNECGKSTLQDFVGAMLYGPVGEEALGRYEPREGRGFGGRIVYHLERGSAKGKVVLRRDFSDSTVLMEGGGAKGNGAVPEEGGMEFPGLDHLGVDRDVFVSTSMIRQGEGFSLRGKWDVSKRLIRLAESGDEDGDVDEAVRRIRELSQREIGSERSGALRDVLDRLEILIREREDVLYRRQDCQHDILARRKEQARWQRAERKLARTLSSASRAAALNLERKLAELRSLQRKRDSFKEVADRGRDLPILDREGLRSFEGRREAAQEALQGVLEEIDEMDGKMLLILSATEGREVYLEMPGDAAEVIAGVRAQLRSSQGRLDQEEQEIRERRRELQLARDEFKGLSERYGPFKDNFEQVLQDLRSRQKRKGALETKKRLLQDRTAKKDATKRRVRSLERSVSLGGGGAVLAAAVLATAWVFGPPLLAAALGLVFVIVLVWVLAVPPRRLRRARAEARSLARKVEQNREEIEVQEGVMRLKREVYRRSGVSSPEEFREGFESYRALEEKIPALEGEVKRDSVRIRKVKAELDPQKDAAAKLLMRGGCLKEGETITQEGIDRFCRNLDEVADIRREKEVLQGLLSLKSREREDLEGQIEGMEEEARVTLEHAGVESLEAFEELCAEEDEVRAAQEDLKQVEERMEMHLDGATILQLEANLASLYEAIPDGIELEEEEEDEEEEDETREERRESVITSRSEAGVDEEIVSGLRQEIQETTRKIAILDSRIESNSRGGRHLADIEADIEDVGRKIVWLKGERLALGEAERDLLRLKEEHMMKRFVPRLEDLSSPLLEEVSGGKYLDLRLDDDLNLKVLAEGEDEASDVAQLSLGTQDQINFILRHSIGRLLSKSGEPLPLILDETFVAFDEERRKSAFRFLAEFSRKCQVVFLTCHRQQAKEVEAACKKAGLRLTRQKVGDLDVTSAK